MVCIICQNMLGRQAGRFAQGTLDNRYEHHTNAKTFQQAVRQNCYICRALYVNLLDELEYYAEQPRRDSVTSSSHASAEEQILSDLNQSYLSSKAFLFLQKFDHTYRLEIELRHGQAEIQHTFYLECQQGPPPCPDQRSVHVRYRTLEDPSFSSHPPPKLTRHRDYEVAHRWIKECKCYASRSSSFYPTRLLSLKNVKASMAIHGNSTSRCRNSQVCVNLVETAAWLRPNAREPDYKGSNERYVTLSHCWGGLVSHRLLRSNYDDFVRGIPVADLPKTFQDAIYFASTLEIVDYIWIDSLCIIQLDKADWLKEAEVMGRVYSETFLNLSATAALNSTVGLFKDGDFELLEEDKVVLDIEGLPMAYDRKTVPKNPDERERFFLRSCTIIDTSFWEKKVDKGPVNTRGWVLQERLMSSRVLHFCRDQVGWECACRDGDGDSAICTAQISNTVREYSAHHRIVEGIRQRLLRANNASYSPFALWAAVVKVYTKTAITNPDDKLIAMSGLAEIISEEVGCTYVAGLWRKNLASQLLWHVEPVFRSSDRTFSHPATSITGCAPSFSWAAIDVTGHGITYANSTKRRVFVRIEDCVVEPLTSNKFGLVSKARIILWGKLRRARLISRPNNCFGWHLVDRDDLDNECHTNVYLDCPTRDDDCIDNDDAHIYILPVAKDVTSAGTSRNEHLVCLLLRPELERGTFKRIGMTKLSPFADRRAMQKSGIRDSPEYEIMRHSMSDASLPHDGNYDEVTGLHRISLI
ncbi:heterokaryon incompatibility protein-domain-containing protein [Boeremia exigua]|uniref:heterokaryon incompatibility protein-domain-containing protein n=1 Tax=Boeremia exigua TaxID=749465 RepID=UPI001E8CF007|nr:heterokaryon incompatibility protein-domain-containing protein [Boeremia exigua]KAH6613998.1 heterokaryon incompatibility protein-domain-containing protein [Boeremia exigua]